METLKPLPMSQKKDDLLNYLGMSPDTYTMMANETDRVYKWLTSDKRHLKNNCKRKPPYDWSDIVEKSKDEAIERIAQSDNVYTSYFWKLATPTKDCPNWIARWFLYHKFRYRDGRNRNPVEREDGKHTNNSSSKHTHHRHHHHHHSYHNSVETGRGGHYDPEPYSKDSESVGFDPQAHPSTASTSTPNGHPGNDTYYAYPSYEYAQPPAAVTYQYEEQNDAQGTGKQSNGYWDPVRDSAMGR